MKVTRLLFAIAGLGAILWGAVLSIEFAAESFQNAWQGAAWLVAGPLVHDAVVAPVVGIVGWLIARHLPPAWRTPVTVGAVLSAILALLAIPLLWRPFGVTPNPGLHDRNYWLGLLIALAAVWVAAIATGLIRQVRSNAATTEPHGEARGT